MGVDEHGPHKAGPLLLALACAQADLFHGERDGQRLAGADGRRNGRAGGGHVLALGGGDVQVQVLSGGNVHHGGHRDGQHAVGTADAAGALVQHGDDDVLDAQIVQAYGRSGDIHDGIHRADLVEMHGF